MDALLAVDAGGTSTRAVVLTRAGECVGYGTAGAGNPISSGPEHTARQVAAAAQAALDMAAGSTIVGSAVLAMAGSRIRGSTEWVEVELRRIGVGAVVGLESDLLATFCSGAWEADGYAVVAGTGAAAIRVSAGRQVATADGLGWLLGDAGSGFWVGRRIVRAAAADLDGRGPRTRLTGMLLDALGPAADDAPAISVTGRPDGLSRLVEAAYRGRPVDLARFAPLAIAAEDDEVAAAILADARAALRATLAAVHREDVTGPVVCGGGVLGALGLEVDGLPGITDIRRVADGAAGAAMLALRANGIVADQAVFERVRDSLGAVRG
jgi:N-acetylglucosamine kinase-like BadF-type ATPase